ncbi:MAG: GNAT family N-acetyltransferase [Eubacteriales bacterium]|nr:GNAT family N-acetyltransferase [Eubacteriales bacterium]
MEFSFARTSDLDELFALYRAAIGHMDARGIFQWDEIYPSRDVLRADLLQGELQVGCMEGRILVAFTLSEECDKEYALGNWRFPNERHCVLHRLCVHPDAQGRGVARETMLYIEQSLLRRGYQVLRLDAFSLNPTALRLYESLGYERAGEVHFRKGLFYFYEKKLQEALDPASGGNTDGTL